MTRPLGGSPHDTLGPPSTVDAHELAVIASTPARSAASASLYALGRSAPCELRGGGEPAVVLAVDEARGERIASALAPHFLVARPPVPWEVIVDAPGCESWLRGVLDGLGLATLTAVVATEPLSHTESYVSRAGGVVAEWFVVASARAVSAGDASSDDRIATLRSALASVGLATRVTRRQCTSLARRAV